MDETVVREISRHPDYFLIGFSVTFGLGLLVWLVLTRIKRNLKVDQHAP